jgi:hypothetical protein
MGQHTADFQGKMYNVYAIIDFLKDAPIELVPTKTFAPMVAAGMKHWDDAEGESLEPHEMLRDWPAAKNNSLWTEHVAKIEAADLAHPIIVHRPTNTVFDGMHRLAKAFRDQAPEISVKYFDTLPDSAIVANHPYRRKKRPIDTSSK